MPRATKISSSLSAEELQAFFELCSKEPHLTGARIQEMAAERGIEIGHNSAAKFKRQEFAAWLEKIEKRRAAAQFISENADATEGATLSDAAAAHMAQELVELQMAGDLTLDMSTDEGIERAKALSLVVHRLRTGDRKMQEELRTVQKQLDEIKKTVGAASRSGGGLSAEALRAMEEQLGWKAPDGQS